MSNIEITKEDILAVLSEKHVSLGVIRKALQIKDKKTLIYIKRLINEMIKEGIISKEGEKSTAKYALNKATKKKPAKKAKKATKSLETLMDKKPAKKAKKVSKPKKVEKPSEPQEVEEKPEVVEEPKEESLPEKVETEEEPLKPKEVKKPKPKKSKPKAKRKKKIKVELKTKKDTKKKEVEKSSKPKKGVIRKGGIAEFMRKRTQLVGFDFGFHKHTQYVVEFIDNSLDAVETNFWKGTGYKITKGYPKDVWKLPEPSEDESQQALSVLEDMNFFDFSKKALIKQFHNFIKPIIHNVDKEPYVIVRIREIGDIERATKAEDAKATKLFCFEIFDNGIGMIKEDLGKFGLYLASSKSKNLKQTRGSQGFGASSAFSDAQNTSAKPVVAITRHHTQPAAVISAFFTTDKNEKKYELEPEEFRTSFHHGTYVKLHYQNVVYRRGYADEYIKQTALLNGHINIIYIDPYGTTTIYQRKVLNVPGEPNYAQPHPSSVSIGDFQELLRNSQGMDLATLFSKSYVRMSKNKAKQIVENANSKLGGAGNIFTTDATKLEDKQLRALHRNLAQSTNCFQRSSPDALEKIFEQQADKPIEDFIKKNFNDVKKEQLKTLSTKLDLKKKKLGDFSKEEIKNIQEVMRDNIYCPYSISFAKFKSVLGENTHTLDQIMTSDFCSLQSKDLNKIFRSVNDSLGNRNIGSLPLSEFKAKEIKELFASFEKHKPADNDITETQFKKFFKSKDKAKISIKKLFKDDFQGVGKKTQDNIIADTEKALDYKSITDVSANELKPKEIKTFYDELNSLSKCPSSITANNLKEILTASNTKNIETALKRNFINLNPQKINDILNKTNDSLGGSSSLELFNPNELDEEQMNVLYNAFINEKYLAPPTDTVVPVGTDNLISVIEKEFSPAFVDAETRNPTSGKGLAFGVEVAIAYGGDVKEAKKATDVLYRFVNRTPKLRDNSDCAIWKGATKVNWKKNYKIDEFDNGLPRGKVRVFVNVSGPFVHVMFKSQSKQALAEDENLIREIELGLRQIGNRLKSFILRREKKKKRARRASLLIKNVKSFAKSLHYILQNDPKLKLKEEDLEKIEEKLAEPIKRDVKKDILSVLSSHWEKKSEIMEDLGLLNIRDKFVSRMVDGILKDLVENNIVLSETRQVDGIKKVYWKLAKEEEEEIEEMLEPEIIVIPGKDAEESEEDMIEELESEEEVEIEEV